MHLAPLQPTNNLGIFLIQRHVLRVGISLFLATWTISIASNFTCRYKRSQFSHAICSGSFVELFVCSLTLHYCQESQQLVETGHPEKSYCFQSAGIGGTIMSVLRLCPMGLRCTERAHLTAQKSTLGEQSRWGSLNTWISFPAGQRIW